jgi:glycosyltransferase involved in cell wall biosynthesis
MVAACPFPARRGTPVRILRMAEELGRRGHDVHVVTYHLGETIGAAPFTVHRIRDVPTYTKTAPGPAYQKLLVVDPLLAAKVRRLVGALRPDVIHAHHYEGLLAALPAKWTYGVPLVFDAHVLLDGELEFHPMGLPRKLQSWIARALDRRAPRHADHVISVSQEIRDRLCEEHGLASDRITVVANGVEDAFFCGRSNAFPDDGRRRLLFAGNLAQYQGVDLMLDAFREVCDRRADVRLVVVTDSERGPVAARAREFGVLDRIEWLAADLARLPNYIASADVALNPRTRCPGLPQKLLNYMAGGAAIVSFAGSAKYIEHGRTGLIAKDGDVAAFAARILEVLGDLQLQARLGRQAGEFAARNLSWAKNAAHIEAVYDELLAPEGDSGPSRSAVARQPMVGLGMPVFNGAAYVAETLESIREQTFTDFELVICDNASTDDTEKICRAYAAADPRIRYYRNVTNLGAHPNYNRTFALARGKYFKWTPHDDVLHPDYLAACVHALEASPDAVVCQTQLDFIDQHGAQLGIVSTNLVGADSARPAARFRAAALRPHNCYEVMGLFRRRALAASVLLESFHGSDRALIVDMALRGRFVHVPRPLLRVRDHAQRYTRARLRPQERAVWHDTRLHGKRTFPTWRLYGKYWSIVAHSQTPLRARARASLSLLQWWFVNWNAARMVVDVLGTLVPNAVGWAESFKQRLFSPAPGIDRVRTAPRSQSRRP